MRELIKGWLGEKMTTFGMWLKLDQGVYRQVHNVILPARNGTTQIDHGRCFNLRVVCDRNEKHGWMDFRICGARDMDTTILQQEVQVSESTATELSPYPVLGGVSGPQP